MSKGRKHIDRFLHDKLKEHSLPVGEMDWDLLEKRRNKKPRRKLGFFVLLFLCSAILAWFAVNWEKGRHMEMPGNESSQNSGIKTSPEVHETEEEYTAYEKNIPENKTSVVDEKSKASKDQKSGKGNESITGTFEGHADSKEDFDIGGTVKTGQGETKGRALAERKNTEKENTDSGNEEISSEDISKYGPLNLGSTQNLEPVNRDTSGKTKAQAVQAKPYFYDIDFPVPAQVYMQQTEKVEEDTLVKIPKISSKDSRSFGLYTWHLSFAYNTLKGKTVTEETEATGAHRAYEQNVKQSAEPITSYNFNGGVSRSLFKGFRANVSAQYTQISQNYSYHFARNEIPFYDTNERIIAYFVLPDSSAEKVNATTKNTHRVINIPIAFNYTFPVSNKIRLGLGIFGSVGYDFTYRFGKLDEKDLVWTPEVSEAKTFNYQYGGAVSGQYIFKYGMGVEISFKYGRNSSLYSPDKIYTANPQMMGLELRLIKDF